MSEYLKTKGEILSSSEGFLESFSNEALLISTCKCHFLNNDYENFDLEGETVFLEEDGNGYQVEWKDLSVYLEVEDKMIIGMDFD